MNYITVQMIQYMSHQYNYIRPLLYNDKGRLSLITLPSPDLQAET